MAVDGFALGDMLAQLGQLGADGGDDAIMGVPSASDRTLRRREPRGRRADCEKDFAHDDLRGSPLR